MECLHSVQIRTKSCHDLPNRDTIGTYDPKYDQPYPESVPNKLKIVSRFPKIVSQLDTLQNMLTACQNRDTLMKSCHDFSVLPKHNLKAYTTDIIQIH